MMKRLRLIAAALCLLAANVIPVAASEGTDLPKVIDDAGILSDYDETRLSSQIDEMTQQYQIDIVLMTENRRQEGTAQAEADMQYVNRGYGIGEGKDGILFLLDMGSREWAISTNGAAMTMFSDYDLSALGDHAASGYFSSDQYYQGFQSYLKELDKTLERNLNPQKEENELGNALASAIADGQKEAESKEEEKAEETTQARAKPGDISYRTCLRTDSDHTLYGIPEVRDEDGEYAERCPGLPERRCCDPDTQEGYLSYQQHHEEADRAKAGQQTALWQS